MPSFADFPALRHVAIASNVVVLELWFAVLDQVITKAKTWSISDHTALLHPEIGQLQLRLTAWTPKLDSLRCCLWSDAYRAVLPTPRKNIMQGH